MHNKGKYNGHNDLIVSPGVYGKTVRDAWYDHKLKTRHFVGQEAVFCLQYQVHK